MKSKDDLPEGKVPPVRVTFRSSINEADAKEVLGKEYTVTDGNGDTYTFVPDAPNDGLAKRVTAEVVAVIRWKISRERAVEFIRNIVTVEEAERQMENELFRVLQHLLPNISVGQAKQNFKWISAILMNAIEERTHDWGIDVEGSFLKMIPLNHELNNAIDLAAEAEFKGRGERELIEQRGSGTAKAAKDLESETLKGRTEGLIALAESLGITGQEAINSFVATQLAESGSAIYLGVEGITQLAGIASAIGKGNGNTPKTKTDGGK